MTKTSSAIFQRRSTVLFLLILIFTLLSISGCMNRREVDKLGLLGAIAVDIKDEQIQLTMEVTKPKRLVGGGGQEGEPIVIVQTSGDSFFDAIRNATNKFDRKIFLSTSRIFIVSEEAAQKGLADILDFWWRDHESRGDDFLVIARGCASADLIGITGGIDDVPSQYLADLIDANRASSKSLGKRIYQFLKEYYGQGKHPTLGVMQINPKEKTVGKNNLEILFEGSAVFNKDKLVGFLDGTETRALNFITGQIKSGIIVIPDPNAQKPNSFEIIKTDSKLDVALDNNKYRLKVRLNLEGMLGESPSDQDLSDPIIMKRLEESFAQEVKNQVTELISCLQNDYGLDIFGFGQVLHRKYPAIWKQNKDNWDKIFSNAEFQVEVKTNISRSGLYQLPVKTKLGK